jgi:hypothetical protein
MSDVPTNSVIGYLTEDPASRYVKSLSACRSRADLLALLREPIHRECAPDALAAAEEMRDEDWPEFEEGLRKERRKQFAGEEWCDRFGAIAIPDAMSMASVLAKKYSVPWGCAFIRLREQDANENSSTDTPM